MNATRTPAALWLYVKSDRSFWIASDCATRACFGRFNQEWWAS
jgi:hypothetical protein